MSFTKKAAVAAGSLAAISMALKDANAGIVYINGNPRTVSLSDPFGEVDWDVDGEPGREFHLENGSYGIRLDSRQDNGRGFVRTTIVDDLIDDIANLPLNFLVGPTLNAGYDIYFGGSGRGNRTILPTTGSAFIFTDNFVDGENFVGFAFDSNGSTLYGWAKIDVVRGPDASLTVSEWAYEDTGAPIAVGAGVVSGGAVPEPSSFALLALGAAGVTAWRLRRKKSRVESEESSQKTTA